MPEHDHQRQIEAAESRSIEKRKGEVQCAAAGQQPNLVAIPDRTDAGECCVAFGFVANQKKMQHTDAHIEAVQHHITDDHHGDQPEPDESHHEETPFALTFSARVKSINWRVWLQRQQPSLPARC